MGFLDNLFKKPTPTSTEERSSFDGFGLALNYNGYSTYKTNNSMTLAAVYRCVEVISNSVASLPLKLYNFDEDGYMIELKNDLSYILSKKPSSKMNAFTFYKLITKDILMSGNAYALITRKDGKVTGLNYIQPGYVTPIDKGDEIVYQVIGIKQPISSDNILHFMNFSDNGVFGVSVLTHARRTLGIADYGEKASENFYKSGGCTSGFLKFDGPSNTKQREEIISAWNQAASGPNSGPNGIACLPANVSYTQLSVSPADAQLLDSRKFQVIDICRFFGVSPVKCFDLDKSSYSTLEMTELSFLNDTLRPLLTKIELEMETKLFDKNNEFDLKFDTTELLRTDKQSQAEYFTKLWNLGVYTTNDIRRELNMRGVEGGDDALVQVNLCKLKSISNYNNVDSLDNRVKDKLEDIQNNTEDDDTKNNEE